MSINDKLIILTILVIKFEFKPLKEIHCFTSKCKMSKNNKLIILTILVIKFEFKPLKKYTVLHPNVK